MKRTWEEISSLQTSWLEDPCWDIENTEGFEEHKDVLLEFREFHEEKWRQEYKEKVTELMYKLQCSYPTAEYILLLEQRVKSLEDK